MNLLQLRDYQIEARDKILQWAESDPAIAHTLVAPMSAGKTAINCTVIEKLVQAGKRVWVIMDREELIDQWKNELTRFAPNLKSHHRDVGIIQGSNMAQYHRPVQLVMVQTLARRLDKIADKYKPDILFYDESHSSAFQRVASKLKHRWQSVRQINLTATPVRHGKAPVQYSDLFPKHTWYTVKSAREMIGEGLWKRPIWKSASDDLAEKTTIRFTGLKESGGDYDDTSQATVMIDLLPHHLAEWQALGGDRHHCVFFCVNVEHSNLTVKALKQLGRKAVAITGESDATERKRAIEAFKKGEIDDLVNCQCLTTGFDAPIASCAVWLRRTLSVGLFNQMAGRVLRKFDGVTEALMLDLAGNLALHPFPELMDWSEFDPCLRMFRDPKLVMCGNCNHRHDAIPTPVHPTDKRTYWLTGQACFKDGLEVSLKSVIRCHNCKEPVYADFAVLEHYGKWLKACAQAGATGKKLPQYEGSSAGISIGIAVDTKVRQLTIEDLYDLGIWKLSAGGEKPDRVIKDRSEEYRELRIKISKNFEKKELCDLRFQLLNDKQQKFLLGSSVARIKAIPDHTARYRSAIALAYINDRSPVTAYNYWDKEAGAIPKAEIAKALTSIWANNPDTYQMLEQWLDQWHENTDDHAKRAIIKNFIQILQSLPNCEVKPDLLTVA